MEYETGIGGGGHVQGCGMRDMKIGILQKGEV